MRIQQPKWASLSGQDPTNTADQPEKSTYQTKRLRTLALSQGQTELLGAMS